MKLRLYDAVSRRHHYTDLTHLVGLTRVQVQHRHTNIGHVSVSVLTRDGHEHIL